MATANHTTAEAAATGFERVDNLINAYLDGILHEFRQLRVWDEHARRISSGGVSVSGANGGPWLVTFSTLLQKTDVDILEADGTLLTGGTVAVTTTTPGTPTTSEVQTVTISGATGGTFTLTYKEKTTGAIAYNASAAQVKRALELLPTIGEIKSLRITYTPVNEAFYPEVWDGQNNRVPPGSVTFDFNQGSFIVDGDDGNQDYFVTYEANLFPALVLENFLTLTLMEINSSAEQGTHLTNYTTIVESPLFWDGPLVYGASAKCFMRLATDGTLWKNFLIWQEGSNGQTIAKEASQYYQAQFDDMRKSVKREKFLAHPSFSFELFRSTGLGILNPYSSKFRGLQINRMSQY
jgi:hypothetical protein